MQSSITYIYDVTTFRVMLCDQYQRNLSIHLLPYMSHSLERLEQMKADPNVNFFHWFYPRWLKIQLSFGPTTARSFMRNVEGIRKRNFFLLDCLLRCPQPMVARALIVFPRQCTATFVMGFARENLFPIFMTQQTI